MHAKKCMQKKGGTQKIDASVEGSAQGVLPVAKPELAKLAHNLQNVGGLVLNCIETKCFK